VNKLKLQYVSALCMPANNYDIKLQNYTSYVNKLKLQHVSAFTLPSNGDNRDIKLQKYTFKWKS